MRNLLVTTLTEQEEAIGFRRAWIENEQNRFGDDAFGEPHILEAVVYPIKETESVWLFKIKRPDGAFCYAECQYGVLGISDDSAPRWHPVRNSNWEDPETAIQAAQRRPRDTEYHPRVPPRVMGVAGGRRIMFDASQVTPRQIERHGGERIEREGRSWVSFPVRE